MSRSTTVHVVTPGPMTTVQDLGRAGLADLGVGHSGACDEPAFRLANRLLGNPASAAALELTLGGLVVGFSSPAWVALTGASADLTVAGRPQPFRAALFVPAGGEVRVGLPATGMRSYLGVRGGIDVPAVLGSRSTDVLTGIGPDPVLAGDVLRIGDEDEAPVAGVDVAPGHPVDPQPVLEVVGGPRSDWFAAGALDVLTSTGWEVSPDSNRVGVRLHGPVVAWARSDELPSEGLVTGAVQVPPSGQPVLFLTDHPVTGGYPVIAVVRRPFQHLTAQLRPGQRVRFRLTR